MSLAYSKCVFVPYPAKEIDWPSELLKLIIELSIKCLLPKSQAAPGFQDLCQITRRVHSDHEASAAQAHRSGTKLGSGLKARANSDLKLKALC